MKRKRIIAAFCCTAVLVTACGCSGKERIEWSEVVMNNVFPEPPSSNGTLYSNSDDDFNANYENITDKQYSDYIAACIDKGFTIDAEKTSYSYEAYNEDGYSIDLSHISDSLNISIDAPIELEAISWPTSTVGNMLPVPESTMGKFSYEYDDHFRVHIGNMSKEEYTQYLADCSDLGFNIDYDKGDTYYRAENADGYKISLEYEGYNAVVIEIDSPDETEAIPTETTTTTTTTSSDVTIEQEDETVGSVTNEATITTSIETTAAPETEVVTIGIRAEVKEAIDSYEAFMDEYCSFMKKYSENPTDLTLLSDYADYIGKYTEAMKNFETLGDNEMNEAELAYYIEVSARVSAKLIELAY